VREMSRPGGEDVPLVFFGTLIVQGHGHPHRDVQYREGPANGAGRRNPAAIQSGRLVRRLAIFGLTPCLSVIILDGPPNLALAPVVLRRDHLGDGMLPEEFPVVLTIFLRRGWMALVENECPRSA